MINVLLCLSLITFFSSSTSYAVSTLSLTHLMTSNGNALNASNGEALTEPSNNQLILGFDQMLESKTLISTGFQLEYSPTLLIKKTGVAFNPYISQDFSLRFDLGFRMYRVDTTTLCNMPYVKNEVGGFIALGVPLEIAIGGIDRKSLIISGFKNFGDSGFNLIQFDLKGTHSANILTLPIGFKRILSKEISIQGMLGYQKIFGGNTQGSSLVPIRADIHYHSGAFKMAVFYKLPLALTSTTANPDVEHEDYYESKLGVMIAHQFGLLP